MLGAAVVWNGLRHAGGHEMEMRTLGDSVFPMQVERWQQDPEGMREEVRDRILLAAGLLPLPPKTPLNAVVHGRVERGDYTVDRVFFESFPGHYVTGSLYLPKPLPSSMPGVLCPHGHWQDGRFMDYASAKPKNVRDDLESGAESRETAARSPLQARCVQLARMGCAVFHWDTLGNADSIQISDHRSGAQEGLKGSEPGTWGLYSAQADLHLQTSFGLHTWNSLRALDFMASLPGVDVQRLAVTGASGGATQTMILSAIDDRVSASFPCVMVSTAMQGGCTCENSHYLRIGQGNVDIAAATAPRPLGLTSADDWTVDLETQGFPDLLDHYRRLGVESNLVGLFRTEFPHNYNQISRDRMYAFMNEHLGLQRTAAELQERDFVFSTREDLTVWTGDHPAPSGDEVGASHEAGLMQTWAELSARVMTPEDQRRAWKLMLQGAHPPATGSGLLVERSSAGSVLHSRGGAELRNPSVTPEREAEDADSWRAWCGYTYGYNAPLLLQQASGIVAEVRQSAAPVELVGEGFHAAAVALAALELGEEQEGIRVRLVPAGFRFRHLASQWEVGFVPGAAKYGDLEGLLALLAPIPLSIEGEGDWEEVEKAYRAAGALDVLEVK